MKIGIVHISNVNVLSKIANQNIDLQKKILKVNHYKNVCINLQNRKKQSICIHIIVC